MSMSTMQSRSLFLLIAALFFLGSGVAAQSTADQNLKTVPQQMKDNAENKASNKATTVGNGASDKVDSGMTKAYKGFVGLFKKKKKNKDSVVAGGMVPGSAPPAGSGTPPAGSGTPPAGAGSPPAVTDTTRKQH